MRTYYGATLAVLLAAATVYGADPSLSVPTKAEAGKLIRLKVENAPTDAGVSWETEGLDTLELGGETELVATGLPGVYKVRATVAYLDGKKVRVKTFTKSITIGEGEKVTPPNPKPNPDPKPKPQPVTEVVPDAWFIVMEENRDRSQYPDTVPLLLETFWNSVPLKPGHWRLYDPSSPDAVRQGFVTAARKAVEGSNGALSYPLVMAFTPSGSLLDARKVGTDETDLRSWVKKITGLSENSKNSVRVVETYLRVEPRCINGVCP